MRDEGDRCDAELRQLGQFVAETVVFDHDNTDVARAR